MGMKMTFHKLKIAWWKTRDYVRYDFKEILFPPSWPDPPGFVRPPLIPYICKKVVKGTRLYFASFYRDVMPDLYPDYHKKRAEEEKLYKEPIIKEGESTTWEDLAVAASGGMETLRPALQRVYMAKASNYKDAMVAFIQGYQEGIREVLEKAEESKAKKDGHAPKGST